MNADKLPSNVHLLTLELLDEKTYLLRLENFMETGDVANVTLAVSYPHKQELGALKSVVCRTCLCSR